MGVAIRNLFIEKKVIIYAPRLRGNEHLTHEGASEEFQGEAVILAKAFTSFGKHLPP